LAIAVCEAKAAGAASVNVNIRDKAMLVRVRFMLSSKSGLAVRVFKDSWLVRALIGASREGKVRAKPA
jgi:hypothetical protein